MEEKINKAFDDRLKELYNFTKSLKEAFKSLEPIKKKDYITIPSNKQYYDIMEVCEIASYYLNDIGRSTQRGSYKFECVISDGGLPEMYNRIRKNLGKDNQYKDADDKTLKNFIKKNPEIIYLYRRARRLESAADRSFENAQFSGGW